jgi:hypothetical protein
MDDRVISPRLKVLPLESPGFPDSGIGSRPVNFPVCTDYSIGLLASALIYAAGVIAIALYLF